MTLNTDQLKSTLQYTLDMLNHLGRSNGLSDDYITEVVNLTDSLDDFNDSVGSYYRSQIKHLVVESFFVDCLEMEDLAERFNITVQEANLIVRNNSRNFFKQR